MVEARRREQPWVTVDVVVVARLAQRHQVLLVRRKRPPFEGSWAIPVVLWSRTSRWRRRRAASCGRRRVRSRPAWSSYTLLAIQVAIRGAG